jgi:peptidoglycan/xylan/chitin deacetylase (PgdA/CDA1 family)
LGPPRLSSPPDAERKPGLPQANFRPASRRTGAAIASLLLLCAACGSQPSLAPTPTPTNFQPSRTATPTLTATASATPFPTPSPTPEAHAAQVPILEYHYTTYRFSDDIYMTTAWWQSQIEWLADNGYTTITAEQLAAYLDGQNLPAKSAMITFDSGTASYDDFSKNIIPTLARYGFHALFFVVTSAISDTCGQGGKFCWNDLKEWSNQGVISVESHGVSHPDYATISAVEQRQDAAVSRQIITEKMGRAPVGFAFPYDSYNDSAKKTVQSAGYQFALAGNTRNDRSVHLSDADRFFLPRVYAYSNANIYPAIYGTGGLTFGQMIEGYSAILSVPTAVSQQTPTLTPTAQATASATTAPQATASGTLAPSSPTDLQAYIQACAKINQMASAQDRMTALANLPLVTDISSETQSKLSQPVLIKPSCNFLAGNVPRGVVLHATRGTLVASIGEFQQPNATSAHYIIDRDGQIYQMVPESLGAFHASCGGTRSVCIPSCPLCEGPDGKFLEPYLQSVGIELVNDGQLANPTNYKGQVYEDYLMSFGYRYWEDYPDAQIRALVLLVNDIRTRWGIPLALVVGHYRINYKTDPGPALNISWYRTGNPPRAPIFTQ